LFEDDEGTTIYYDFFFIGNKTVRYPSMSLSPTLSRNEKDEQHIRKKTHKLNALRFWIESGVIILYGFGSVLILVCLPGDSPSYSPNKWYQSRRFVAMTLRFWVEGGVIGSVLILVYPLELPNKNNLL